MQIGKVCSFPAVECRKIRRLNLHETVPGKEESESLPGWRPRCLNDQRVQVGRGTRRTDPILFGSDSDQQVDCVSWGVDDRGSSVGFGCRSSTKTGKCDDCR
jgi:hypothetical protein